MPALRPETFSRSFPKDHRAQTRKTETIKYTRLKRYAARAGLEPIRVHDLRHSHVSLLIDQGFTAVAIADRVGHESAEITYTYAHLFPNAQADMAERLDVLMGGAHGEGERLVA